MAPSGASARQSMRPIRRAEAPRQAHALARGFRHAEALAGGDARHPGDLAPRDHHRRERAARARDLAVGEEVLQRAAAGEPQRTHAVARAPAPHLELRRQRRGVERGGSHAVAHRQVGPALAAQLPAGPRALARDAEGRGGARSGALALEAQRGRTRRPPARRRRRRAPRCPLRAPRARISVGARRRPRGPPAGLVGESLEREARERRRQRRQLRASPPAPASAHRPRRRARPPRRAARRASRSTLASAAGWIARSAASSPWRSRLRANCVDAFVGSSRQGSPRSRQ